MFLVTAEVADADDCTCNLLNAGKTHFLLLNKDSEKAHQHLEFVISSKKKKYLKVDRCLGGGGVT